MPRRYPLEFRRKVLDLLKAGRTVAELVRDLQISDQTIYDWRRQERIDTGQMPGITSTDQAELVTARRRIAELESELAIHRRATELRAKARTHGAVLVCTTPWPDEPVSWPDVDLTLTVTGQHTFGLSQGRGRIRRRDITVQAQGRGAATRPQQTTLEMPPASLQSGHAEPDGFRLDVAPVRRPGSSTGWTSSLLAGARADPPHRGICVPAAWLASTRTG